MDEMEKLRLQIRDRDLEIINLQAQIRIMKCCENCKHYLIENDLEICKIDKPCSLPNLKSWELKR